MASQQDALHYTSLLSNAFNKEEIQLVIKAAWHRFQIDDSLVTMEKLEEILENIDTYKYTDAIDGMLNYCDCNNPSFNSMIMFVQVLMTAHIRLNFLNT